VSVAVAWVACPAITLMFSDNPLVLVMMIGVLPPGCVQSSGAISEWSLLNDVSTSVSWVSLPAVVLPFRTMSESLDEEGPSTLRPSKISALIVKSVPVSNISHADGLLLVSTHGRLSNGPPSMILHVPAVSSPVRNLVTRQAPLVSRALWARDG